MTPIDYAKKCPFCGGNAILANHYNSRQRTWFVVCQCDICGAQARTASNGRGNGAPDLDDFSNAAVYRAVQRWNQRYKEDEQCRTES